ncbi:THO complex subunit 3, partial [Coelomomyces lativittatus]
TGSTGMAHIVLSVSYMPDAPYLLVMTANDSIELLDPRYLGQVSLQKRTFHCRLNVAQIDTSDSLRIFVGLEDGQIHCLDATKFEPLLFSFPAHVAPCTAIAFDPMGRWIASGGLDSLIVLYEWDTLMPSKVCKYDEDAPIRDLWFTYDGEFLSAAADSSTLTSWATEFGLPAFVAHTNSGCTLEHVRWHPRKPLVACTYKRDRFGKFFLFSQPDRSS